jgi:hyperosmotically inducible protein
MRNAFITLVTAAALCTGGAAISNAGPQDTQQPAPDNTKNNRGQQPTADQQKMNASDRETTKKIRDGIHKDKSLSTYAHNVKIITQGGKVTLKGPVRSDEEKASIEQIARSVAGAENVENQLEVAPKNP